MLDRLVREEFGRVLATLIRVIGDFDLAEESVQDALIKAMEAWPRDGVPDNPRAWIVATARNRAIDQLRRRRRLEDRQEVIAHLTRLNLIRDPEPQMDPYPDDRLKLLFTCCHPALSLEARVALTLRTLGGLTTEQIARAFVTSRTTMQQRIVRAKRKITGAGIPYEVPGPDQLAERFGGVLYVVYLIFNEGYAPTSGPDVLRPDLAEEAIALARLLRQLCPDDPEALGLLALLLLQHSRAVARIDAEGDPILLEDQDRRLWDREAIEEGLSLVPRALGGGGPFAVQAAIAALHARAESPGDTDWVQILGLYGILQASVPSPVVALNRAVAASMVHGPSAGLRLMEPLSGTLQRYHLFHSARGELLRRVGRPAAARAALQDALALAGTEPERRWLRRRIAELDC